MQTPMSTFKYEVLYYKRSSSIGRSRPAASRNQMDGILCIEVPTSLVTLLSSSSTSSLQQCDYGHSHEKENGNKDDNDNENDVSSTCSSSDENDNDNDSESDDSNDTSNNGKMSLKLKMKKMRQKFQKKQQSKLKNKRGKKSNIKKHKKQQQHVHVYSAVNASVAKSASEKGGLNDDSIVILSQAWECQIVRQITSIDTDIHATCSTGNNDVKLSFSSLSSKNASVTGSTAVKSTPIPTATSTATTMHKPLHKQLPKKQGFNTVLPLKRKLHVNGTYPSASTLHQPLRSTSSSSSKSSSLSSSTAVSAVKTNAKNTALVHRKPPVQPMRKKLVAENDESYDHDNIASNIATTSATSCGNKRQKTLLSQQNKPKQALSSICNKSIKTSSSNLPSSIISSSSKITAPTTTSTFFPGSFGSIQAPNSIKSILRPHQIAGIVFLWNCVTGSSPDLKNVFRNAIGSNGAVGGDYDGDGNAYDEVNINTCNTSIPTGAILADEMGLGKTLMTITVLFALHRRNRNEVSCCDCFDHTAILYSAVQYSIVFSFMCRYANNVYFFHVLQHRGLS